MGRVEVIDADPAAFGASPPGVVTEQRRRRRAAVSTLVAVVVVVVVVVVAVVVVAVAPQREPAPAVATTTTSVVAVAASIPSGRPAASPVSDLELSLIVQPGAVSFGSSVTMRLDGDLTIVPLRVAAVAWVDHLAPTGWRTVYWMSRTSATGQTVREVFADHPAAGPDAVMVDAAEPIEFTVDRLASGTYRLCRYVPLSPEVSSGRPRAPAYLCAPLEVNAS